MAYYPAGYCPMEPWSQKGTWNEGVANETLGQKEQGDENEAAQENAGSVQGGECVSLESYNQTYLDHPGKGTTVFVLCEYNIKNIGKT